jgi:hypothetical protein
MQNYVNKIEVFLIVIIILSIFALTHIIDTKVRSTTITHNPLLSQTNLNGRFINNPFSYDLDAVTEIEVYNSRLERVSKNVFKDDHKSVSLMDFENKNAVIDIINTYPCGHLEVVLPDKRVENVYFRWGYDENNTRELVMIYNAGSVVTGLWLLNFLCYLILVFVFGLVILHKLHTQDIYIRDYQATQNRIQERMR